LAASSLARRGGQRRALEHVGQRAVDDAFLEHVGVHHQVEQRTFEDHVAAPFDEAELRQQAQVHVHARLLAQLVAEVGQQRGIRDADRGVFGARDRVVLVEQVVLVVRRPPGGFPGARAWAG
jgi:hypothetical protein